MDEEALRSAQRLREAESLYQTAIALHMRGDFAAAAQAYQKVVAIVPGQVYAWSNLGLILRDVGQYDQSIVALRRAAALAPDSPPILANLAAALNSAGQSEAAIPIVQRALQIQPDHVESLLCLGGALHDLERLEEAIGFFEKAVSLQPENPEGHWGLAMSLLRLGEFSRGWKEFEWRLRMPRLELRRDFREPQWQGQDPAGKTILLFAEGGFGDAIQFIRLAPEVARRGAKIILECQPELIRLLAPVPGIYSIIRRGDPLPPFDWQIPLQGLPMALGIRLETIPSQTPYLSPPRELSAHWRVRLASDASFKIGLVWAGSERRDRSHQLELFKPLANIAGTRFFSLQKGPESSQRPPPGMNWADFTSELRDFADTAALLQQMDLLITVDTAAAHLAGALGKPVWVLIPRRADFRWLRGRGDSPWYPTMRLFLQDKLGDWESPIAQIAAALRTKLAG
ncbi:MAG: tetratricopeptide repeat protein [Tepidisphaeraceae bacterium]|jgi:Flp pilus assembly protein TadD